MATIETDKIDVAVNTPDAGVIKEFLASEEDTVTVDQDLIRLDVGAAPKAEKAEQADEKPKSPASIEQATASQPSGNQEQLNNDTSRSAPEKNETDTNENQEPQVSTSSVGESTSPVEKQRDTKADGLKNSATTSGGREERRVSLLCKIAIHP